VRKFIEKEMECLVKASALADRILRERGDQPLEVDAVLTADRAGLESRDGE